MQLMSRRQAAATEQAVKAYSKGANVYALAYKYGIEPSTLYRALRSIGIKFARGNGK